MNKIKGKDKKMFFKFLNCIIISFTKNVYAASDDPIAVVNNLSDFIFQITKVVGGIIVAYSVVQLGLSFTNHDASQRVNAFLFFTGGVIIMCAKAIMTKIAG